MENLRTRKSFQLKIQQENKTLLLEPLPTKDRRVVPSSYIQLVRYLHEGAAAPIGLRNVKVTSEVHGEQPYIGTASFDLDPRYPTRAFVLLEGGWTLPGPWVDVELLMLDRNVVIDLEKLPTNETEPFSNPNGFWADLLGMCSSECNLLSFAIEGRSANKPGLQSFLDEISRAYRAASRLFPKNQLPPLDAIRLQGGIELIGEFDRYFKKASVFLGRTLPMLAKPIPSNERFSAFQRIEQAAKDSKLMNSDIIVLLAISCLYDAAGGKHLKKPINPGREILKPTKQNFYNAAFDTWLMELVIGGNAIFPRKRLAFVTKDKGLAALWCLLEPREFRIEGGIPKASITLSQLLFPAMPDKQFSQFIEELRQQKEF